MRRMVVQQHVLHNGHVCPGYEREAHMISPSSDNQLTADHVIPLSMGGSRGADNLQVLCRDCNSTKKDTLDPLAHAAKLLVERMQDGADSSSSEAVNGDS